jgi:hypothetical protein
MARGFESKDVEFQQSEAVRPKSSKRPMTPVERDRQSRRLSLQLALSRAEAELDAARSTVHRRMLEQAVAALHDQIRQIS